MSYALRRQPNGSYAVYHLGLRETMHPHLGPWAEATRLYAGGSGLERALTGRAQPGERAELVVFDVGLGGAANALAAIACREGIVRAGRQARPLAIVSFERELAALAFALDQAERLDYLSGHVAAVRAILAAGAWEAPGVRWELRQGDFVQLIQVEPRRADIVFYDPFSHRTNPELWSVPVLQAVYRSRRPGSGQRLVTYSSAFGVRAALLLAGYFVGEGVRLDGRPTTLAATSFADLEQPLDPVWLGRWRRDREPWPPGTDREQHKALRDALLGHAQWSQFEADAPRATVRPGSHNRLPGPAPTDSRDAREHRAGPVPSPPRRSRKDQTQRRERGRH